MDRIGPHVCLCTTLFSRDKFQKNISKRMQEQKKNGGSVLLAESADNSQFSWLCKDYRNKKFFIPEVFSCFRKNDFGKVSFITFFFNQASINLK